MFRSRPPRRWRSRVRSLTSRRHPHPCNTCNAQTLAHMSRAGALRRLRGPSARLERVPAQEGGTAMSVPTRLVRRFWPAALATSMVAVAVAFWLAPTSSAVQKAPQRALPRDCAGCGVAPLGLLGLTEGQTLRISVANIRMQTPPVPDVPCELEVSFVDRQGRAVGDPNLLELAAGAARSFDFVVVGDPTIRHYVRPVVVDLQPKVECAAVVSGEILDRGGISGIIINYNQPVLPKVFLR